ncbi:MAG: NAD(P)/FAD-dependent oxidoreductase [Clostridiales bacterium]
MKNLIIIGAGIAGLTAGIYAQKNGFKVKIFELHNLPGGECTGWNRGDYHFDGCIHWLMGTSKKTSLNKLWKEVGALDDDQEVINHEIFSQVEFENVTLKFYRDAYKLEKHWLEIAPEDNVIIKEFCNDIRKLSKFNMPTEKPYDKMNLLDGIKMIKSLPLLSTMKKYDNISMKNLTNKFKNNYLKNALKLFMNENYKATSAVFTLASLHAGDSGWPVGGSLAFSKRMAEKFKELGGIINYKSKVDKILVKSSSATGIKLENGDEFYSDYVISCADGYNTLYKMLDGKYINGIYKKLYESNEYKVFTTIQVSFGIKANLSKYEHRRILKLNEILEVGGMKHEFIPMKHYCCEPSFSPENSSVIISMINTEYDWWKKLYSDTTSYKEAKNKIANKIKAIIEDNYPEAKDKIETIDIATPVTYERYCNAWKGSWMSFITEPGHDINYLPGILDGLDNFYLSGQWCMPPGGLPGALLTGRWVIWRLCNKLKIKFTS